jgi:hypothetical protein
MSRFYTYVQFAFVLLLSTTTSITKINDTSTAFRLCSLSGDTTSSRHRSSLTGPVTSFACLSINVDQLAASPCRSSMWQDAASHTHTHTRRDLSATSRYEFLVDRHRHTFSCRWLLTETADGRIALADETSGVRRTTSDDRRDRHRHRPVGQRTSSMAAVRSLLHEQSHRPTIVRLENEHRTSETDRSARQYGQRRRRHFYRGQSDVQRCARRTDYRRPVGQNIAGASLSQHNR